ncbi:MAG: aspartate aminotransferase family protein [Chloroflexi bacterium]|nr:aspartate aminotransferase family protein [Chloroflexota bacterium]
MRFTLPSTEEIRQMARDHYWPHTRPLADMDSVEDFKIVVKGEGCWVTDLEGNRYMDALAGLWLENIGYGRKEMAEAVYEAMLTFVNYAQGSTPAPTTIMLADKLASLAPDKNSRVFFCSGGSEAVETALKLAKSYHKQGGKGGKYKVISRRGSYHGATWAAMSAGGGGLVASHDYGPEVPGNVKIHNPSNFQCPHSPDRSPCTAECARELEWVILGEGPDSVAAVLGEPISAASGIHIPDPEYWSTFRKICDKYDVLLIADEVINAFGRTGRWFGSEHWNLQPDLITVAKALTGGYLPVGAVIASKKVSERFEGDKDRAFRHLLTFGGHPIVAAAGLANLQIIEREKLLENSAKMGHYLLQQLQSLYEYSIVGQVRGGLGLLAAVELVKDRKTKERIPREAQLPKRLTKKLNEQGLLGRFGDVINIAPPLVITKEEVDFLVKALQAGIRDLERELATA